MVKKIKKIMCGFLAVLALSSTACTEEKENSSMENSKDFSGEAESWEVSEEASSESVQKILLPCDKGLKFDKDGKLIYDKDLLYLNDCQAGQSPDPQILDNTSRDGYYYLYSTHNRCFARRSKDLYVWEDVGDTLFTPTEDEANATIWDLWAEEVVYDEDTKLYYMFVSASPKADEGYPAGEGVGEGTVMFQLYVATSKSPAGPFRLVNFLDAESCGEENLHSFNQQTGLKDESGNYVDAYPQYFAKYCVLSPEKYNAFADSYGRRTYGYGGYTGAIDAHPFIDPVTGKKLLYWTNNINMNSLCVVEMETWLKPKWETATPLLFPHYYTLEDWFNESEDKVPYELEHNFIIEGAAALYHNGKYYLTYSVNEYANNSYCVGQAVADSPFGPFRRLTVEEGGLLISAEAQASREVSGTGHHCFVTVGNRLYMVYHKHTDLQVMSYIRATAIDEVKWITVTDKFGKPLEVMYINGPTNSVQPKDEAFSGYKNIAPEAAVESDVAGKEYLTDGLLSHIRKAYGTETFADFVKETEITKNETFTFSFTEPRQIRGIMVYNSKKFINAFEKVNVDIKAVVDGKEVNYYISNLKFDMDTHSHTSENGIRNYITPCASAWATFDEITVKSVSITVRVPAGQNSVGISEIEILGK